MTTSKRAHQAEVYLRIAAKADKVGETEMAERYRAKANSLIIRDKYEQDAWLTDRVIWLDEM